MFLNMSAWGAIPICSDKRVAVGFSKRMACAFAPELFAKEKETGEEAQAFFSERFLCRVMRG